MNPDIQQLQPYPFEKLNALKAAVTPPSELSHIALSIGEPKHQPPGFVLDTITENIDKIAQYPATKGIDELRQAISQWAEKRFSLKPQSLDPDQHILPVNGTREAIFAFAQATIDRTSSPLIISPNPFYQIYEGATYLAGAELMLTPCLPENNFIPDFSQISESTWQRCQMIYLCSPGNPTGAVIDTNELKKLIELADRYDFIIASDECYSELYFDEANPPAGLLQACAELGRDSYERCVVFHSLSKRSNLPGLRSGFVAGDAAVIKQFLHYRTYHGCAMPMHHQLASIAAWSDENHVIDNRTIYRKKFDAVLDILDGRLEVQRPDASFYLWPKTPIPDPDFAQQLFAKQHITVLPGSYLSRTVDGINPGENRVRMALVAPFDDCVTAAKRIKQFVDSL